MTDLKFRKRVNIYLMMTLVMFGGSLFLTAHSIFNIYRADLETLLFPVYTDRTHVAWERASDGTWSSVVFINKIRPGCIYVKEQKETVIAVTAAREIIEANLVYIGDRSPGSNRPQGWQQLDLRVRIDNPRVTRGSTIRGSTLHRCSDGPITVTEWGPAIVGIDEPLPYYVTAWYESGRKGRPGDHR